jgi:hypothetical protein
VHFPLGPPPADALARGALRFSVHGNEARASRSHQRHVAGALGGVRYTGGNFGAQGSGRSPARFAVGVYDPAAGTVRIAEVACLFAMAQTVEGVRGAADDWWSDDDDDDAFPSPDLLYIFLL